jgi:glycosyltransferase involved in cell wall biosynthesis
MRVRTVPVQPHCFLYGGFDIQMDRTHEALRSVGVDARPLDWWSRDEQFEILHVWGLDVQHRTLVRIAKDHGKKVALTPLLPYVTPISRLRHIVGIIEGRKRPVMDTLRHVDVLLVVNRLQADAAMKIYGFPSRKIEVIPTMLDPLFFDSSSPATRLDALQDYIVCAGNIWPRKNQVRLARAALRAGCSVVFVGNSMGGEEAYTEQFQRIMDTNPSLKWHKWLSWDDLYRVLRHASGIALPSLLEYQPASCLEAVALQKPLLMANKPYAYQEFFKGALTVDAKSEESIAAGLVQLMVNPGRYTPKLELVNDCRPDLVALKLRDIFERLLSH